MGIKLNEINGEIEENWKFNGQLKVNLHKSNINDQNEKNGWNWSLLGVKLHKNEILKLIRVVIEKNHKSKY